MINEGILNGILIFGIIQSTFFAILFLTKKSQSSADKIIGFWLLILAVHILLIVIKYQTNDKLIEKLSIAFTLLHGPFLLIYVQRLTKSIVGFDRQEIFHFIPFFIAILLSLSEISIVVFATSGIISGISYCFTVLILLRKHRRNIKNTFSFIDRINLYWLLNLTVGLLVIWIVSSILVIAKRFFYESIELTWFFSAIPVFIFYIGFYGIKQQVIYSENELRDKHDYSPGNIDIPKSIQGSYKKSGLQNDQMKKIHQQLLNAMDNDKLYLNSSLNLSELSKKLNIPPHHITQTLNEFVHKNFYDFINSFRVEAFRTKINLEEFDKYSLLGIALDCGFNSKSSFNRIFKNSTGLSPSEYKKKNS